ncbi:MAG TPA: inositol monophosphatase family protein [Bryobacteraceae bacterium]|nr:inositol monophosphatase family protein [Bryobacteraceae bacterium]
MVLGVAIAQAIAGANTIQAMAAEFRQAVVELKESEGNTPVTEIDRESARRMTRVAQEALGNDVCVIDEELGVQGDRNARWQCYQDSCDGTTNFFFEPDRVLPVAGATYVRHGSTECCAVADLS